MARLASHPQLTSSVEKFRSQFPDWESTLPPLVDNLGVRVKHRKRNRERMSVASTAEGGSSKTECENATNTTVGPVVQKHSATLEIIKDKIPVTQSLTNKKKDKKLKKTTQKLVTVGGVWEVEVEDEHAITFSEQNIDTSSCSAQVQGQSNGKTKIKTAHKNTKSVPTEPSKTSKITTTDKSTVNKSSATKVIRFSELIEMETKLDKIRKTKKVKKGHNSVVKRVNDKPTAISEPKEVDSFFVSEDGKTEFLSIVTAKEPLEVRDETQLHKYAKLREKYLNEYGRIPNRKELRMRERQKFSSGYSSFTHEPERSTSQFESKRTKDVAALDFQPKSSKPIRPLHAKASEAEGPVHPSWEAKRKAKEMLLTTFQGKKIKFED